MLWSIACSFRLGVADAADAVQNTWLKLVERLDHIAEPDRLGSWLATTARRECLQLLRRTSRERPAATATWLAGLPDGTAPVDTGILLEERDAALWNAVGFLPERCQQLLRVLMAAPPPTYRDVAAALDMPMGTIGPSRQRCLEQLRKVLAAQGLLTGSGGLREEP
jgi:RNA polymerase sigma factor (sigma-70 family)